jgi:tetratricopeptide (TPR) repeat protein
VARALTLAAALALSLLTPDTRAQAAPPKPPAAEPPPDEPEEEDAAAKPKEYSFNPLQAEQEIKIGRYYMRRGSHKAAAGRFIEATKWNPQSAEAWLLLGEAREKLKDPKGAKEAYRKYLDLAPDEKNSKSVRKKIEKLG